MLASDGKENVHFHSSDEENMLKPSTPHEEDSQQLNWDWDYIYGEIR